MSDMVEKAKNNVHDVKWELEKIRSMALHNQDAVERVHHYTVATYGVIKTKKNEKHHYYIININICQRVR